MPKPEINSVAVSGMVMTFQPSSCLNSLRMRLISVVLPAAGPPVNTIRVICFAKRTAPFLVRGPLPQCPFTGSFVPILRYENLKYTKYSCGFIPCLGSNSLAECSRSLYQRFPIVFYNLIVTLMRGKCKKKYFQARRSWIIQAKQETVCHNILFVYYSEKTQGGYGCAGFCCVRSCLQELPDGRRAH